MGFVFQGLALVAVMSAYENVEFALRVAGVAGRERRQRAEECLGLVGLRRPAPRLFEDMRWSTPQVMQHTRQRAAALGLRVAELEPLADIDVPADLVHLPPGLR